MNALNTEEAEPRVDVYALGLVCCSVCAPAEMNRSEVERLVNADTPTGIGNGWVIASDPTFADGTENGVLAICGGKQTRHYLMTC